MRPHRCCLPCHPLRRIDAASHALRLPHRGSRPVPARGPDRGARRPPAGAGRRPCFPSRLDPRPAEAGHGEGAGQELAAALPGIGWSAEARFAGQAATDSPQTASWRASPLIEAMELPPLALGDRGDWKSSENSSYRLGKVRKIRRIAA